MEKLRDPKTGATIFASKATADRLRAENADKGKSLAGLTKAELIEHLEANEIEVDAKATKGEILELIEAVENADEG